MKIDIFSVGRNLRSHEQAWIDDYLTRLRKFAHPSFVRIKEPTGDGKDKKAERTWQELKKLLPKKSWTVLLDPQGKLFSTEEFKNLLSQAEHSGKGRMSFIVGGAYGLPEEARRTVDTVVSLSPLTLPHRVALLVLAEQMYRVLSLKAGAPYHHA